MSTQNLLSSPTSVFNNQGLIILQCLENTADKIISKADTFGSTKAKETPTTDLAFLKRPLPRDILFLPGAEGGGDHD